MPLYLLDIDQEMMDACEFLVNNGLEIEKLYPAQPNFWCLECNGWCAKPLHHLKHTSHNIARAEPIRK